MVEVQFRTDGFYFQIQHKRSVIHFPIEALDKTIVRDPDWQTINALEQLFLQGALQPEGDGYLLSPEDFYALDRETAELLPLPRAAASLWMEENQNIGAKQYSISWYLVQHGKNAGKSTRRGCIASALNQSFLLSESQYRLIREIESWQDDGRLESRARFQAKCKFLAQNADVQISQFTEDRDFLFADNVSVDVQMESDQKICLEPELPDIPDAYRNDLPDHLEEVNQIRSGRKHIGIFASPDAAKQYNSVSAIPDISGADVPRFLRNPLQFLPESVEYDADDFSKRVKGLKVRTARAVPYIQIDQTREEGNGWFPVSYGSELTDDSESSEPETAVKDTPELEQLLRCAAQNGEEYVYYDDTWIRVDPEQYRQYFAARDKIEQTDADHHGRIRKEDLPKILDIFQNLEGMEYDETRSEPAADAAVSAYALPRSLCATLKDYQLLGYYFLRKHYESGTGVLLADDMGLGKTVQMISLLAYLYDINQLSPVLLVLPMSLVDNWKAELQKFLPAVREIYVHQGPRRFRRADLIREHEVVMTTYETLARDQTLLGRIRWSCVICDEAQKVKNFNTLAAGAVKGMNTRCRIALTGTPVENRLSELWSIVDFVQPGLLGSYKSFRTVYEVPIQTGSEHREERANQLIDAISPIFLRRKKEDVLAGQLPSITEKSVEIPLTRSQLGLYQKVLGELGSSDKNNALGTIQRLMMLCSHPRLVTKQAPEAAKSRELQNESAKLGWTIQKLNEIRKRKEKAIVFTRYLKMQAMLRQAVYEEFHIDAPIINGSVKGSRLETIREFEAKPGFHVMILSPRAAGVGLNILGANHVIHYTREWNPAVENQATDRVYRIGQTKPVSVYYPVMETDDFLTVEERLDDLLKEKREIMKSVIIPTDIEIKAENFYDLLSG